VQNRLASCDFDCGRVDIDPAIGSKLNIHFSATEITTFGGEGRWGDGDAKFISGQVEIVLFVGPGFSVAESVLFGGSVVFLYFV
jgi:hypothetical protein